MQNYLSISVLCLISIFSEGLGYGYSESVPERTMTKSFQTNNWPNPVYGPPLQYLSTSRQFAANNHQNVFKGPLYLSPLESPQPNNYHQRVSAALPVQNTLQTSQGSHLILTNSLVPPQINAQPFVKPNHQVSASENSINPQFVNIYNSENGMLGDYVSQSESGQLDYYNHKQKSVGEERGYSRNLIDCFPDGSCNQQQLGPGKVDSKHQQIVLSARARIQPFADKCRLNNQNPNSLTGADEATLNSSLKNLQIRPLNRRLYPYTETVMPNDPFN